MSKNKSPFFWIENNKNKFKEDFRYKKGYTEVSRLGYYNTREWKDLRALKISEQPLCEHCLKENKFVEANVVDHIIPIYKENINLFYDYSNLQSLCNNCHFKKTRRDNSRYNEINLKKGNELKAQFENYD